MKRILLVIILVFAFLSSSFAVISVNVGGAGESNLTGFVPYTGATQNLNLGQNNLILFENQSIMYNMTTFNSQNPQIRRAIEMRGSNVAGRDLIVIGGTSASIMFRANPGNYDSSNSGNFMVLSNMDFTTGSTSNVVIGSGAGNQMTNVVGGTLIGNQAGLGLTESVGITSIGLSSGLFAIHSSNSFFMGEIAGAESNGERNYCFGYIACGAVTGSNNYMIGHGAGLEGTFNNVFLLENFFTGQTLIKGDFTSGKLEMQDADFSGDINVTGTVYYGALVANSPHAFLADKPDDGTRICMQATDGTVLMQKIELIDGRYQPVYYTDEPECQKEVIRTKNVFRDAAYVNGVASVVERTEIIHENVWSKEQRLEIIENIKGSTPNYKIYTAYRIGDTFQYPEDSSIIYEVIQDHFSQPDWKPNENPALYKIKIIHEFQEVTVWQQPLGAHDCYPREARVIHNNKEWENVNECNVWEPGIFGWVVVE